MKLQYVKVPSRSKLTEHHVVTVVNTRAVACTCPSFKNRLYCYHMNLWSQSLRDERGRHFNLTRRGT